MTEAHKALNEISDPGLREALAVIADVFLFLDAAQWPISAGDKVGGGGKKGSRPPGRKRFASQRDALIRLAADADKQKGYVVNALAQERTARVEVIGGVRVVPVCEHCGGDIPYGKNAHAQYCSPTCRKLAAKGRTA